MRILVGSQTYYPGNNGQAIFTIHLAEGLARAGHDVHLITAGTKMQYQRSRLNGVMIHSMPQVSFHWLHPNADLSIVSQRLIQNILEEARPEIVHIQDHYFLSRGVAKAAQLNSLPVVGTNHFLPENILPYVNSLPLPKETKINLLWKLMLETYNHLNLVTTPTETAARILRSQNIQAPVVPVSCGVDTRRFRPAYEHEQAFLKRSFGFDLSSIIFLYVGRHDCEKRIDLLIRAASLLRQKGRTDIRLVMAGQGASRDQLESLARSYELGMQASFLGFVPADDLPRLYRAADIFAMPSPEELQSIATLEAMASGKPVMAANSRALPELVTRDVNGLLFTPGDEISAANAMEQLVNHKSSWQRMGWASRSRAVSHSLDATIRQYETLYLRLDNVRRKEIGSPSNHRLHTFFTD